MDVWLLRKVCVVGGGGGGWHSRIESLQVLSTLDLDLDCDNCRRSLQLIVLISGLDQRLSWGVRNQSVSSAESRYIQRMELSSQEER